LLSEPAPPEPSRGTTAETVSGTGDGVLNGFCLPLTKYWITMPITFEKRMNKARPAGNWNVKNPNMIGSIQSIIWFV